MAKLAELVPDIPIGVSTSGVVFVEDCETLAELVAKDADTCSTGPEHVIGVAEASPLGQLGAIALGAPYGDAPLDSVIARARSDRENIALQAGANALFGPSQVLGWDQLGPNPNAGWISSLGLAAAILLGASLLLLVINVVRFPTASDRALRRLAASDRIHREVLRWELQSVVVAAAILGAGYGLLITNAGQPAQITRAEHWPLALGVAVVGVVVAAVVEVGVIATVRSMRPGDSQMRRTTTTASEQKLTVPS